MYDSESVGEYVTRHPKVWCDCRLARDDVSGVCVPLVLWLLPGYPMLVVHWEVESLRCC